MNKINLKIALSKIYCDDSVKSILSGRMQPSMTKAIQLYKESGIPLDAWLDIKSYINNNTSKNVTQV